MQWSAILSRYDRIYLELYNTIFFMASNQVYSGTINSAGQAQLPEAIGSAASSALSLHSKQTLIILHRNHSHDTSHKDTSQRNIWNFADHRVLHLFLKCGGEMLFSHLPCPSLVCSLAGYSGVVYLCL